MSSENEDCPVDLDWLRECTDDDPEAMRTMANLYVTRTTTQLVELESAIARNAALDVHKIAHGCVGSSGTCGMTKIAVVFKELEKMGKAGELAGAGALSEQARAEFERIKAFLTEKKISGS